jgi:hypothetical protein
MQIEAGNQTYQIKLGSNRIESDMINMTCEDY